MTIFLNEIKLQMFYIKSLIFLLPIFVIIIMARKMALRVIKNFKIFYID